MYIYKKEYQKNKYICVYIDVEITSFFLSLPCATYIVIRWSYNCLCAVYIYMCVNVYSLCFLRMYECTKSVVYAYKKKRIAREIRQLRIPTAVTVATYRKCVVSLFFFSFLFIYEAEHTTSHANSEHNAS